MTRILRHKQLCSTSHLASQAGLRPKRRRVQPAAGGRLDVQAIIPMLSSDAGAAAKDTPPDLPSYLFKERIIYLGMPLVPAVTELMISEFMWLQYQDPDKPISLYINSMGGHRYGFEHEAFAIYDLMRAVSNPVHTLCIGTAFGEAALILSAGAPGMRGALPSSTVMLRQPMNRFEQMQASDVDIYRMEMRKTADTMVQLLSRHTGHNKDKIRKDIARARYFGPYDAVDYNLIDKVLESDKNEVNEALRSLSLGSYEWNLTDPPEETDKGKERLEGEVARQRKELVSATEAAAAASSGADSGGASNGSGTASNGSGNGSGN